MFIYKITNLINGKLYIGQTSKTIAYRWYRHNYAFSNNTKNKTAIHLALKKYGKINFSIEEIDTASNIDELNKKEKYWINILNTLSPNGYNLTTGGDNKQMSDETKEKIRIANTGKTITEETRQLLRDSHKGYVVKQSTKDKLSIINKNKTIPEHVHISASWKNSKLYLLKCDNIFYVIRNMKFFCDAKKLHRSDLSELCTGIKKNHKGYELIKNFGKLGDLKIENEEQIKNIISQLPNIDFTKLLYFL